MRLERPGLTPAPLATSHVTMGQFLHLPLFLCLFCNRYIMVPTSKITVTIKRVNTREALRTLPALRKSLLRILTRKKSPSEFIIHKFREKLTFHFCLKLLMVTCSSDGRLLMH